MCDTEKKSRTLQVEKKKSLLNVLLGGTEWGWIVKERFEKYPNGRALWELFVDFVTRADETDVDISTEEDRSQFYNQTKYKAKGSVIARGLCAHRIVLICVDDFSLYVTSGH
jgi:hypothetical protein